MKILWLTWKDRSNPLAGGAEVVNEELAKRLAVDGHEVIFLVGGFKGGVAEEDKDGYRIIRLGNRVSVYWRAYKYYKNNLRGWADLVIDEVNTIPFFAKFYVHPVKSTAGGAKQFNRVKEKNILFVHQLCRQIWFYEIFFPLNFIGYILEPVYLWLLSDRKVITVSESTRKDLIKYGFKKENIHIISEGIEIQPAADLEAIKKYDRPTILTLGNIKAMKRTDHIVKAFELAREKIDNLQLVVAGKPEGKFGQRFLEMLENSKYKNDIEYLGPVTREKKIELMQKAHLLSVTSVKEGWGLVVTEANCQGTPAVVYDIDGLRDSVKHNETGIICQKNTPETMAKNIVELLHDQEKYQGLRIKGWESSREINFEKSYADFLKCII